MNATFDDENTTLSQTLDQVIAQHGRFRVFGALLLRVLRHRGERRVQPLPLNAHLRRDIGLGPMDHGGTPPPGTGGLFR